MNCKARIGCSKGIISAPVVIRCADYDPEYAVIASDSTALIPNGLRETKPQPIIGGQGKTNHMRYR